MTQYLDKSKIPSKIEVIEIDVIDASCTIKLKIDSNQLIINIVTITENGA